MKGKFISFEGIEGAGKSSTISYANDLLRSHNKITLLTREPGGTELGEAIRRLLLGHHHDRMTDITELLLMFAARAEHLHSKIIPALENGTWVLCDRFTDASFAYQGGGRELPTDMISTLEKLVQGELRPDMTLLLDLPVELGLKRAKSRSRPDRFEKEHIDFFKRVRQAYLHIAKNAPERIKIIDASVELTQVQQQIHQEFLGLL